MAPQLGLPPATASGVEGAAQAVLDALRRGAPYQRWLLIFDNADQPEELGDIIPHGPGDVLITSRNPRWQAVVDTVAVDVFSRAESIEFLGKRVPSGLNPNDADQLADELGDLPLALEQAGALQAETGMPVEEYLRLLRNQVSAIMAEGKSPDYPLSMTAAWKLSVSTLEQQLQEAVVLLRCCAFFGPEPIPRDLFRRGASALKFPLGALLAHPIRLARAVRELGRFALVRLEGGAIVTHRLVQALLRDGLSPDEQASYREEGRNPASWPQVRQNTRIYNLKWPRFAELVAHASSLSTQLEESENAAVRAFAIDVIRYLYNSGDLDTARGFAERFIKQWNSNTDPKDTLLLRAQRHLGNVFRALGQYEDAYALDEELAWHAKLLATATRLPWGRPTLLARTCAPGGSSPLHSGWTWTRSSCIGPFSSRTIHGPAGSANKQPGHQLRFDSRYQAAPELPPGDLYTPKPGRRVALETGGGERSHDRGCSGSWNGVAVPPAVQSLR